MKFLFLFFALAVMAGVQALTPEQMEKLKATYKTCMAESGADTALIQRTRNGDFDIEDDKVMDFYFCLFKKTGIMTADGKLDREVAISKAKPEVRDDVTRAIDACKDLKGATDAETAWRYAQCYHKERPNHETF